MRFLRLAVLASAAAASVLAPVSAGTTRDRAFPGSRPAAPPVNPERRSPSRVRFEPNLGQWDEPIRFLGRGPGCQVMLADAEAVFRLGGPAGAGGTLRGPRPGGLVPAAPGGVLRMEFVGGKAAPRIEASGLRSSVSNYFLGNDRSRWRTSVPHYDGAAYRDLWPGIDLAFRGDPLRLEYDLVVAPGADLSAARLRFSGQSGLSLDAGGSLVLRMERGEVRQEAPRLWQDRADGRREVAGAFRILDDGAVGFEAGPYDRALPLVVDPVVNYASYLGGSTRDWSDDVAVDGSGSIIVVGWTDSTNFPLKNPLQGAYIGGGDAGSSHVNDAFVTGYSTDGLTLAFSTYFGGNGFDDCLGVVVDANGDIVLCGLTSSTNFPTASPFQSVYGGGFDDMYLAKMNSTGSSLVFSTYYGGPAQDEAYDVAVDSSGIYVAGATNDGLFPTKSAVQSTYGGGAADALVAKFNPAASSVAYATYYGGTGLDAGLGIAVDSSGSARVVGLTDSPDFPVSGGFQAVFGQSGTNPPYLQDSFCLKLASSGSSVSWASYLGGTGDDYCDQVAFNAQGETFLAGHTASAAFPTVNALRGTYGGGVSDAFCAKVNAQGSGLLFSTYWGGTGTEYLRGMAVDASGNVVFCGLTSSRDFPIQNAFQGTYLGTAAPLTVDNDGFVVRLNSTGTQAGYSSYFGGVGADDPQGLVIDPSGNVVIAGLTDSAVFPTVNPQQGATGGGLFDAYVLRIALVLPAVPSVLVANLQGNAAVQLSWADASNNETGFEVEKKTGPGAFVRVATLLANVVGYQDLSIGPMTTYTYRVRAVNGDGPSGYTNEASVTTGASISPPTSPNNLQVAVVSSTQTALTWTDRSTNENLFEVERKVVPGAFGPAASLPADTAAWNDTGLGPDSSLVYRVRAVGVTSPSAWSNEVAALTTPSLGLTGVKASLTDSATAAKDKAKAKGIYSFLPASPDGAIDPVAQGVTILVGSEQDPAVVTIPPGSAGWVLKKSKATWKTPKDSSTKVTVVFDLVKRTFSVALSKITFPGPVTNPVRVSVRVGNDAGSSRATWVNRKPGAFSYKQP